MSSRFPISAAPAEVFDAGRARTGAVLCPLFHNCAGAISQQPATVTFAHHAHTWLASISAFLFG